MIIVAASALLQDQEHGGQAKVGSHGPLACRTDGPALGGRCPPAGRRSAGFRCSAACPWSSRAVTERGWRVASFQTEPSRGSDSAHNDSPEKTRTRRSSRLVERSAGDYAEKFCFSSEAKGGQGNRPGSATSAKTDCPCGPSSISSTRIASRLVAHGGTRGRFSWLWKPNEPGSTALPYGEATPLQAWPSPSSRFEPIASLGLVGSAREGVGTITDG